MLYITPLRCFVLYPIASLSLHLSLSLPPSLRFFFFFFLFVFFQYGEAKIWI